MRNLNVNTNNLKHNINILSKYDKKIIAVVKNNFYGIGYRYVAHIDKMVSGYAVNTVNEAKELKTYTDKNILILSPTDPSMISSLDDYIYTITSMEQLEAFIKSNITVKIAVKINSGNNKFGISSSNVMNAMIKIKKSNLNLKDIYTSISPHSADFELANRIMIDSINIVLKYNKDINIHMHDTTGVLSGNINKSNYVTHVRLGMGILGIYPTDRTGYTQLKLALDVNVKVTDKKKVSKGSRLGNTSEPVSEDLNIIILPIGYSSGFSKILENKQFKLGFNELKIEKVGMNNTIISLDEKDYDKLNVLDTDVCILRDKIDLRVLAESSMTTQEDIIYKFFN